MADNIYYIENYTDFGTHQITDDGSGTDWIIVRDYHVAQNGYWGAFINLFNVPPAYSVGGINTFPGNIRTVQDLTVYGQIENAMGGGGNELIQGGSIANIIVGDPDDVAGAADALYGAQGDDTLYGGGGSDTIYGGDDNDLIFGDIDPNSQSSGNISMGDDSLDGGQGNDTLYGGMGTNQLNGGTGYDTADYSGFFDDFGNFSYRITANLESGTVAVYARDLFDHTESIVASDSLTGIDVIIGTAGDDWIDGKISFTPDDFAGTTFYGGEGNDRLTGMLGADVLYGGAGNDYMSDYGTTLAAPNAHSVMSGGTGNDYYNVMAANIDVVESQDGGYDYVWSAISYTLPAFVEHLYLSDIAVTRLDGTGNVLNNQLEGTHLANLLSGLGGNDYLVGFAGNDTLNGGGGAATLVGGTEADKLFGGTEADSLEGGTGADILFGGSGNDRLLGGAQSDKLTGGTGADRMTGGTGVDYFIFAKGDAGTGPARDTITDFASTVDKIDLKSIMAGQVFIQAAGFHHIAGEVRYDAASGVLSGDTDGNGSADYQIFLGLNHVLIGLDVLL